MTALFIWMRYALIVLPGIVTLYLVEIDDYAVYTAFILLSLLLISIRQRLFFTQIWGVVAEVIFFSYMASAYKGGLLYLFLLATVMSLFEENIRQTNRWALLTFIGAAWIFALWDEKSVNLLIVSYILLVMTVVMMIALNVISQRQLRLEAHYDELSARHYELERIRQQLLTELKEVEYAALMGERNRISKDIHDELGHRLIRLKLMLDAALRITAQQPQKALDLYHEVREQLVEGMDILRATVNRLAPKHQSDSLYSLNDLTDSLGQESGVNVSYFIKGRPVPLYPSLELVLYRNAQEAITNAIRHGGATQIEMILVYEFKKIKLIISNNGAVPLSQRIRKGLGLKGMEDRVAHLGGRVELKLAPTFTVTTTVPLNP